MASSTVGRQLMHEEESAIRTACARLCAISRDSLTGTGSIGWAGQCKWWSDLASLMTEEGKRSEGRGKKMRKKRGRKKKKKKEKKKKRRGERKNIPGCSDFLVLKFISSSPFFSV